MKKVIVFLLVLSLALGGIVFAHAAVTDSQDELLVYPTLQLGDTAVLEGRTAALTITCGEHLRWLIDYPFGGQAVTEFAYSRSPLQPPSSDTYNSLDIWLTAGMGSSVSGGEFSRVDSEYGALLEAVAAGTPAGGSKTMSLTMSDYVNHYLPDYQLRYEDEDRQCSQSADLYRFLAGEEWYEFSGCYVALMQQFRFPVQPGHVMSVTVDKDDAGRMVGIELHPESGSPELHFLSDLNSEGIWFVPVFRDENGTPLPYESPAGHGIYFIPWMHNDRYLQTAGQKEQVTPNVNKAQLILPLDEDLRIEHLVIDAENGTARMLTLEDGMYVLSTCDLGSGTVRSRLELLPFDPADTDTTAVFRQEGDHLLVLVQSRLVLTDAAGEQLLLTAPDFTDQTFGARTFDPDTGDLRFEDGTLILTDTAWYQDGTFWTAAWQQDAPVFYGEYDCSIMRGNDNWYYSYVTAQEYPITLN